jgi:hypothetical protein
VYRGTGDVKDINMTLRRNQSYSIPQALLDQITRRAEVAGRSANEEMRQLQLKGLSLADDNEVAVEMPRGPKARRVVWQDHETSEEIKSRSRRYNRSASAEGVLLMAYALPRTVESDLAIIREMMSRVDPAAPAH